MVEERKERSEMYSSPTKGRIIRICSLRCSPSCSSHVVSSLYCVILLCSLCSLPKTLSAAPNTLKAVMVVSPT